MVFLVPQIDLGEAVNESDSSDDDDVRLFNVEHFHYTRTRPDHLLPNSFCRDHIHEVVGNRLSPDGIAELSNWCFNLLNFSITDDQDE
jgi:hypothetical protein